MNVVPLVGVNENVRSNAVGTKTIEAPMTWPAGSVHGGPGAIAARAALHRGGARAAIEMIRFYVFARNDHRRCRSDGNPSSAPHVSLGRADECYGCGRPLAPGVLIYRRCYQTEETQQNWGPPERA